MMEANISTGPVFTQMATAPHVIEAVHHTTSPVPVSSGVLSGMLLEPIRPRYPEIARIARVEGTVIVEAVITSAGAIAQLRVVSGPPMLRQAALDAIRTARYQPYRLNGNPIEVQTTISVNFRLGS
ncbi:MAG TPA: energy transducer TonB [Edaphobacter sp.]|nr:energy transducer TonB [Edaphobacter sp.]